MKNYVASVRSALLPLLLTFCTVLALPALAQKKAGHLGGFPLWTAKKSPLVPVLINWTPSVPYRIVYVDYCDRMLSRGDLVVYSFGGQASERDYPGLKGQPFFKRVVGLPGHR